jgi:hypothetical protein
MQWLFLVLMLVVILILRLDPYNLSRRYLVLGLLSFISGVLIFSGALKNEELDAVVRVVGYFGAIAATGFGSLCLYASWYTRGGRPVPESWETPTWQKWRRKKT